MEKPRKGQTVYYATNKERWESPDFQPIGTVTSVEGNLCYYKRLEDGEHSLFIWRFKDGFNKLHTTK